MRLFVISTMKILRTFFQTLHPLLLPQNKKKNHNLIRHLLNNNCTITMIFMTSEKKITLLKTYQKRRQTFNPFEENKLNIKKKLRKL